MPDAKESQIAVRRLMSPADPETWPELDVWMAKAMVKMHDLLRPLVKSLDACVVAPSGEGMGPVGWQADDMESAVAADVDLVGTP